MALTQLVILIVTQTIINSYRKRSDVFLGSGRFAYQENYRNGGDMVMEATWKAATGELRVAYGDDFERMILHYLRVCWPNLIRPTHLQQLDRYGIDLCTAEQPLKHEIVVQAKGFRIEEELTESQVTKQIIPSIRKFINSPVSCNKYLLVHNRQGSSKELRDQIEEHLNVMVEAGSANEAYLWDLSKTIKEIRNKMDSVFREKLHAISMKNSKQHDRMFHFGAEFLEEVPLRTFKWNTEGQLPSWAKRPEYVTQSALGLVGSPKTTRYTILTGSFGMGKTTTTLRVATKKGRELIYIRASNINRDGGGQGTNFLMRNIGHSLDLLNELPEETKQVLSSVVGAVLGRILRQPNDDYILVIDGLDEHPFYSTPKGLQWLSNEIAELRCPIVLTTRVEHLEQLSGNYRIALNSLSTQGGARRAIRIIELGPWTVVEAIALLNQILPSVNSQLENSIRNLISELKIETDNGLSQLISHPLFLNMTLDLFVAGETEALNDSNRLIESWMIKKIERDLTSPRLLGEKGFNVDDFVLGMISAMRFIAVQSKNIEDGEIVYTDSFYLRELLPIAQEHTNYQELDEPAFLSTSLFIPVETPTGEPKKVRFFHRRIQEYLASKEN